MNDIDALIDRARQSAAAQGDKPPSADDRQKLLRIAQEFESMLLVQVLRDMRRAGRWDDEEESEHEGLGAASLFETVDVELASHLARAQGLGLSTQLLSAFDRIGQGSAALPARLPVPASPLAPMPVPTALPALQTDPLAVATAATASPAPTSAPPAVIAATEPIARAVPAVDPRVTSSFGWRRDPFTGHTKFHRGVDLAAAYGQDVQAARAGRVLFSGEQGGYGNTVVVEHPDGSKARYAHLSAILVTPGAAVAAGEPVGRAGHSGRATGTHVHFEITTADGRPVAPDSWVKGL